MADETGRRIIVNNEGRRVKAAVGAFHTRACLKNHSFL